MPQRNHELPTYAGCLVYHKQGNSIEILLVKPAGETTKKWQIPQIEVDANENFGDEAAHEVKKETGVDVNELGYLGFVDYPKRRLHCFIGRANQKAHPHKLRMTVKDVRFFPLDEAIAHLDKRQRQLLNSLTSLLAFSEIA